MKYTQAIVSFYALGAIAAPLTGKHISHKAPIVGDTAMSRRDAPIVGDTAMSRRDAPIVGDTAM
ncbi:hypothetical protein LX32DRAFT_515409, partial [Colletotrichum zoysiae]